MGSGAGAADTFPKLLAERARTSGDRPAFREKEYGIWQTHSWTRVADNVNALAAGLAALGFRRGDRLIVVGDNRPRLYWAMTAAQSLGGVPVPVYQDAVASEMAFVVEHAGARFAIAEDQEQVDKLIEIKAQVPTLETIIFDDPRGLPQPELFLERQRADGGWNCKVKSDRSSFNTTITGLEALIEYERAVGGDSDLAEARARAHEYLLQRRLMYSLTTGELINAKWLMMSFPPRWFYDVLRALDYMADAGLDPDPRLQEPIEVIMSKRFDDGTWPVQNWHSGKEHFRMEPIGKPSRWNTLRVLRVLRWYQRD